MLCLSFQFAYLSTLVWVTYKIGISNVWSMKLLNAVPWVCFLILHWWMLRTDVKPPSVSAQEPLRRSFFKDPWSRDNVRILFPGLLLVIDLSITLSVLFSESQKSWGTEASSAPL